MLKCLLPDIVEVSLRRFLLCLILIFGLVGQAFAVPMSAQDVVVREASAFLSLLDQQRYVDAWRVGTQYFRSRLSAQEWEQILRDHREPLGPVRARRKLSVRYVDSYETAPPGTYMQVEFSSTFGRTKRLERLVVKKDFDGNWRITGYQLR